MTVAQVWLGGWVTISKAEASLPHSKKLMANSVIARAYVLPGSLRFVADAPNCDAEEKIGHPGRDDVHEENPRRRRKAAPTYGSELPGGEGVGGAGSVGGTGQNGLKVRDGFGDGALYQ